jgi:hypothetical protein
MKRIAAIALFAVVTTFGVANAMAQEEYPVRATMPFNFTVGNKSLPAGTYTILQVRDDLVEIRNQDGKVATLSTAYPYTAVPYSQVSSKAVVVFNRYGSQYFLHQIAGGPSSINENVPVSKSESRVRHQENFALNQSQVAIPIGEGN